MTLIALLPKHWALASITIDINNKHENINRNKYGKGKNTNRRPFGHGNHTTYSNNYPPDLPIFFDDYAAEPKVLIH